MHYADIIATLHKTGYPPCKVADNLGVSRSSVSQVIRGTSTSYDIATYISSVTNKTLIRLWPDGRYNKPPKRIREAQAA